MNTKSTFTVVFEDGTEKKNLTFDEADEAMKQGEESGNSWTRAYVDNPNNNY
jgi:hypothetical protein